MPNPSPISAPPGSSDLDARLKKVVQRIYDLPSFPLVIQKVSEVAEDPRSSSKDLAQVMEADQGLATKVLKLVNSAFYGFPNPVSSLHHAITLLGYNSVRSLALSVSVKGMFRSSTPDFDLERFWEHSLATALAAKTLADWNRLPGKEEYFTAGLLHDVGILVEARYFPDELSKALRHMQAEGVPLIEAEDRMIGVNHCLLGAWLAETWRLPPLLRESMLRHHEFETPARSQAAEALPREVSNVVAFVTAANLTVRASGFSHERRVEATTPAPAAGAAQPFELPRHLAKELAGKSAAQLVAEVRSRFQQAKTFLGL